MSVVLLLISTQLLLVWKFKYLFPFGDRRIQTFSLSLSFLLSCVYFRFPKRRGYPIYFLSTSHRVVLYFFLFFTVPFTRELFQLSFVLFRRPIKTLDCFISWCVCVCVFLAIFNSRNILNKIKLKCAICGLWNLASLPCVCVYKTTRKQEITRAEEWNISCTKLLLIYQWSLTPNNSWNHFSSSSSFTLSLSLSLTCLSVTKFK